MTRESSPVRSSPDHLIGQTLASRYLVEHKLGEGAMGAVYRARHVKVGRSFAVKVLHAKLLDDNKVAQRFEREAELAGRLSHANVVGVVDVGETPDGLRYMVMDFAEGEDLAGLLAEAPFTRERIIRLTRQMLEGLYHAHEAGLIHRDFKPENVIVSQDDHGEELPRIVDFGIAILREGGDSSGSEGRLTTNGLVLGTPHYMAPEQAVADPIDHRIDLFALGIVIYEMLCGKLPFDGTGAEVARANLLLDPPPISQRVPYLEVDPLLEALARRLMAKKRDQRPATAREARELLDLIEREPAQAAAALNVTVPTRIPAVTQEVVHQSVEEELPIEMPGPVVVHVPAPPPRAASPERLRERAVETAMTDPLAWDETKSKKRLWLGIAGAGLVALIIAIFAMKSGSNAAQPAEPEQKVVMTPQPPPAPAPEPKPEPVEVQPEPTPPPEIDMPAATAKRPVVAPKRPVVAKEVPRPTPPAETPNLPTPSSDQVQALYSAVASDIGAVASKHGKAAAADLWRRYRMIQIQDATATPAARLGATATLTKLRQDAAATK